jgi:hypothetical protein
MNLLIFLAFLVGVLTKVVDNTIDEGWNVSNKLVILFGFLYGFFAAYVIRVIPTVTSLAVAVMVSLLVTKKIDHPGHGIGIGSFIFFSFVFGFPPMNLNLFFIFTVAALLDEILSNKADKKKKKNMLYKFFEMRLVLEIVTFTVSAFTGIWELWVCIFLYDIGAGYIPLYRVFWKSR